MYSPAVKETAMDDYWVHMAFNNRRSNLLYYFNKALFDVRNLEHTWLHDHIEYVKHGFIEKGSDT